MNFADLLPIEIVSEHRDTDGELFSAWVDCSCGWMDKQFHRQHDFATESAFWQILIDHFTSGEHHRLSEQFDAIVGESDPNSREVLGDTVWEVEYLEDRDDGNHHAELVHDVEGFDEAVSVILADHEGRRIVAMRQLCAEPLDDDTFCLHTWGVEHDHNTQLVEAKDLTIKQELFTGEYQSAVEGLMRRYLTQAQWDQAIDAVQESYYDDGVWALVVKAMEA